MSVPDLLNALEEIECDPGCQSGVMCDLCRAKVYAELVCREVAQLHEDLHEARTKVRLLRRQRNHAAQQTLAGDRERLRRATVGGAH